MTDHPMPTMMTESHPAPRRGDHRDHAAYRNRPEAFVPRSRDKDRR